jgi:hypothetical protein
MVVILVRPWRTGGSMILCHDITSASYDYRKLRAARKDKVGQMPADRR